MKGRTQNLDPVLVDVLTRLEAHMGFELTVTSGQRTQEHNDDPKVGGVKDSEHTYKPAKAADVLCKQSTTRYKMKQWLYANGVKRIGTGKDFIHIGVATDKPASAQKLPLSSAAARRPTAAARQVKNRFQRRSCIRSVM